MNKETARSLLMDYLYDELEEEQRLAFEEALTRFPDLRADAEKLSGVRSLLTHLPVKDPQEQLLLLDPSKSGFLQWWNEFLSGWLPLKKSYRLAFGFSFLIGLFVVLGSLTRMSVSINNNGFNLSFGEVQETAQPAFTPEQVDYLIQQVKQENARMVSEAVQAVQANQEEKLEKTLFNFADYIEQQRLADLNLISDGLVSLEESYSDRFHRTDLVLGEIIQTVNESN